MTGEDKSDMRELSPTAVSVAEILSTPPVFYTKKELAEELFDLPTTEAVRRVGGALTSINASYGLMRATAPSGLGGRPESSWALNPKTRTMLLAYLEREDTRTTE